MNTGLLKGWQCPSCGNTASFEVTAVCTVVLADSGAAQVLDWNPRYENAVCSGCGMTGVSEDFHQREDGPCLSSP
jgi:predicted nucleic-acid-binding Zn-ribbon protein